MMTRRFLLQSAAVAAACSALGLRGARAANAPGVTDTEIKIGQAIPYTGPGSAYGAVGRTEATYFKMINDQGGINGRKITFMSLDDGYDPTKTLEQTRRLVEQERVAFMFNTIGTSANASIREYLNDNKIADLFIEGSTGMFADPQHFPWMIPSLPSYETETHICVKHILATDPDPRIAVRRPAEDRP